MFEYIRSKLEIHKKIIKNMIIEKKTKKRF